MLLSGSRLLWSALERCATHFECDIVVAEPICGIWLRPSPHADDRFLDSARLAAAKSKWPDEFGFGPKPEVALNATTPEGLHALRASAQAQILRQRGSRARADKEGLGKIDIETASQPFWKEFLNTFSDPQKSALRI